MRAAVLEAPGRLVVMDRPVPVPGPREILIRVKLAGICGTDLALYAGEYETDLPIVPGHEFCGEVVQRGKGVPEQWLGAYVTSEISLTCLSRKDEEKCRACKGSLPEHCERRQVLGIRGADGAFAERIVVPVGAAHRLPEKLPVWSAVLVEPLAAALQTFELTPVSPGDTVVVLGAGRLGLLVCKVAKSYGAHVVAVDPSKQKRSLAGRFGAHEAVDPGSPGANERLRGTSDGLGAHLVVECTGRPEGLAQAIPLVRPRGTVALKTTGGPPAKGLPTTDIVVREITIQGSRCGPYEKAIERLTLGKIPVEDYVSGVLPLEDIAEAFEASRRSTKVLLEIDP